MSTYNAVLARNTKNAPKSMGHYSQTVAFSHYNNISAQLPVDPKSGEMVSGGVKEQTKQCLENIQGILESIDHVMSDIVKITIFLKNISDLDIVHDVYATFFSDYVPTLTIAAVSALPMDALIQIEAIVSNGEGTIPGAPQAGDLIKIARNTENAPLNPFATQTVAFSHYNNLSAQLPIVPHTGKLITGGVEKQTEQCLKNIKAILESIDVPFDDIVKINIFLKNLSDIKVVDEVYTTFFPDSAIARTVAYVPARTVIAAVALPMDALVQIEAVVSHGDGTPPQAVEDRHGLVIKFNNTPDSPINALSTQTVAFSHYNHLSAQLPFDPQTGQILVGDINKQTERCLKNIKAILDSINHSMDDVVKVNISLKHIKDIDAVDNVCTAFFSNEGPARRVIGVSDLPQNALVQIEVIVSNAEGTPPTV